MTQKAQEQVQLNRTGGGGHGKPLDGIAAVLVDIGAGNPPLPDQSVVHSAGRLTHHERQQAQA